MQHLPPTGIRAMTINGHGWNDLEYLAALVVDAVRANTASLVNTLGGRASRPKPVPRPGDKQRRSIGDRGEHDAEEVVSFLDSLSSSRPH